MMFLAMIATWVVPLGSYECVEDTDGNAVVVPDSCTETESTPIGFFSLFKAIPEGLTDAGMIA